MFLRLTTRKDSLCDVSDLWSNINTSQGVIELYTINYITSWHSIVCLVIIQKYIEVNRELVKILE